MRVRDVHESAAPPAVLDKMKLAEGAPAAPAITFYDAEGKALSLNDFRGRYVLVNLWATWCGPCINELPSLVRLQAALPQDRITVLPLDLEKHDPQKVAEFSNAPRSKACRSISTAISPRCGASPPTSCRSPS